MKFLEYKGVIMLLKEELMSRLQDMELFAKTLEIEPFELYLLGGSASILGGYTNRSTRDFDFIDLDYSSNLGRVFRLLGTFDFLDYCSTILSPTYKERAIKLKEFKYLNIYILSPEDIIVSKIIRLSKKDQSDIKQLIIQSDIDLINQIIRDVLNRDDLIETKKIAFKEKITIFKEMYHV